jgi:glycogen(starch) synthase
MEVKADLFFEVSWEVCNKVGGIHTVVTSKVIPTNDHYKESYFLIGPFFKESCFGEFQEKPTFGFLKEVFDKLKNFGIECHLGNWLTDGEPSTILVDYSNFIKNTNDIKKVLWENFKIDSLGTSFHDFDEPIVWSTAVGILLEEISKTLYNKKIVAQFHEWLSGGALLYLKSKNVNLGTVFTTHATMLGRTLAGNHVDLYNVLNKIDPEKEAYRFGIQAKFHCEKQCALNADVFTTVSEITGLEATHFFGKKPDVLLPNGLDIEKFPTFEDASIKHKMLKRKIKEFILYYFFPYYSFDLDNTLIYFIAGRYEIRDKGIDLFIKALSKLNNMLIKKKSNKTIVAFVWVPAFAKSIKNEILKSKMFYGDIKDSVVDISNEIKERIIYGLISKQDLNSEFLLGENLNRETKKRIIKFNREGLPPVCTHNLSNENSNEIINLIIKYNLMNKEKDKVKVIYYPIYLTGADSLIDLTYYEAIIGSHFGIFPSYYEPWGYTPLETGALGVASLTTDLAGFGRYIEKHDNGRKNKGIFVLKRLNNSDDQSGQELANIMYYFTTYTKQDRIENKLKAKRIASTADWKLLIENYIKAHNLAIQRAYQKDK